MTGWAELAPVLASELGLPDIGSVWIKYDSGADKLDGPYDLNRASFSIVRYTPNITVVVGVQTESSPMQPAAVGFLSAPAQSEQIDSEETQNWRRVKKLFEDEPCPVPRMLQQVMAACPPSATDQNFTKQHCILLQSFIPPSRSHSIFLYFLSLL